MNLNFVKKFPDGPFLPDGSHMYYDLAFSEKMVVKKYDKKTNLACSQSGPRLFKASSALQNL